MSWAIGYDTDWRRDIGYGVPSVCDHPGCNEEIDRGLGYVCGGEPYGGDDGCGLFFCGKHLHGGYQLCARCTRDRDPFTPKADTTEWLTHKLTDESWQAWREQNPSDVALLYELLKQRADQPEPARNADR